MTRNCDKVLSARFVYILFTLASCISGFAQSPTISIDLNYDQRQESEVHEPDYLSWQIPTRGTNITYESKGITFDILTDGFASGWYKAGIQSPNFARLVNDGMISPKITIKISGLSSGTHSLTAFHNSFSSPTSNTFAPIDVFVGDELTIESMEQTNRVHSNESAATSYVTFTVAEGEAAYITYEGRTDNNASNQSAHLNGFALNKPNSAKQAKNPYPAHADMHADCDSKSITLQWKSAPDAISHDVYISNDSSAIFTADKNSAAYIGTTSDTSISVAIDNFQIYYWRVDETTATETTRGEFWRFQPRILAFEEAEGFGRYARGGRGGVVVEVTNLNDDGPGSLREAVSSDIGPRTIVFRVSGLITLKSRLTVTTDQVTVAGQTAPGKGICIRSAPFGMSGAEDVIIQNMRVRLGSGTTYDGMGMTGSNFCIIDHCSISWTIDESFSSRNAHNITFQRNLISEPLNIANHQNYPNGTKHGYAASISGDKGSFHHNLLAHSYGRNWSLAGGLDGNGFYAGRLDISNNVVYNFGSRTTDGGAHEVNFVNNYYKPGPGHQDNNHALNAQYDNFPGTQRYYFAGNVMPGHFDESNQTSGRRYSGNPQGYSPWVNAPFFDNEITLQSAEEAYKTVLSDVGCIQPVFDDHDNRIITETLNGSYTYTGSRSRIAGMPDSHEDVGGWEDYPEILRVESWDSDHDGLPDWWEKTIGSNPNSGEGDFSDSNADPDLDGHTQLEDYLHWMDLPHYFVTEDTTISIDLAAYSKGYQNSPVYTITHSENINAEQDKNMISISSKAEGFGSLIFKVTDADESTFEREMVFFSGDTFVKTDTTDTTQVLSTDFNESLLIYPNPATHRFSTNVKEWEQIKIYDLSGQAIMTFENPKETNLDISTLPTGVYIVKIWQKETLYSETLIKK